MGAAKFELGHILRKSERIGEKESIYERMKERTDNTSGAGKSCLELEHSRNREGPRRRGGKNSEF